MCCSIWAFMQSYTMVSIIHMFGRVYGYVCVLCVYKTYLYTHIYYTISVYVCGEHNCWFSPDIYSCIPILNMYIACRCPAYTCVYVTNLGWQFFSPLFANCCPLWHIFTEAALYRRNGEMSYQSFILKRRLNYLKPFVIVFWIFTRRVVI